MYNSSSISQCKKSVLMCKCSICMFPEAVILRNFLILVQKFGNYLLHKYEKIPLPLVLLCIAQCCRLYPAQLQDLLPPNGILILKFCESQCLILMQCIHFFLGCYSPLACSWGMNNMLIIMSNMVIQGSTVLLAPQDHLASPQMGAMMTGRESLSSLASSLPVRHPGSPFLRMHQGAAFWTFQRVKRAKAKQESNFWLMQVCFLAWLGLTAAYKHQPSGEEKKSLPH